MILNRPEKKKYENIAYPPNQDWINGRNAGFNQCHDLDTAWLTGLLKEVREAFKKYDDNDSTVSMGDIVRKSRYLIERVDKEVDRICLTPSSP